MPTKNHNIFPIHFFNTPTVCQTNLVCIPQWDFNWDGTHFYFVSDSIRFPLNLHQCNVTKLSKPSGTQVTTKITQFRRKNQIIQIFLFLIRELTRKNHAPNLRRIFYTNFFYFSSTNVKMVFARCVIDDEILTKLVLPDASNFKCVSVSLRNKQSIGERLFFHSWDSEWKFFDKIISIFLIEIGERFSNGNKSNWLLIATVESTTKPVKSYSIAQHRLKRKLVSEKKRNANTSNTTQ